MTTAVAVVFQKNKRTEEAIGEISPIASIFVQLYRL
jgi:hypothetical protein